VGIRVRTLGFLVLVGWERAAENNVLILTSTQADVIFNGHSRPLNIN
jgi:hypothetical protein